MTNRSARWDRIKTFVCETAEGDAASTGYYKAWRDACFTAQVLDQWPIGEVMDLAISHEKTWQNLDESLWFHGLVSEVTELAGALAKAHRHTPDHELKQIAAICLNWLRKREREAPPV